MTWPMRLNVNPQTVVTYEEGLKKSAKFVFLGLCVILIRRFFSLFGFSLLGGWRGNDIIYVQCLSIYLSLLPRSQSDRTSLKCFCDKYFTRELVFDLLLLNISVLLLMMIDCLSMCPPLCAEFSHKKKPQSAQPTSKHDPRESLVVFVTKLPPTTPTRTGRPVPPQQ